MEEEKKKKLRRSMLFLPGSRASLLGDAFHFHPDSVIFDLEDAVSVNDKASARFLVRGVLKTGIYRDNKVETVVRINGLYTPYGEKDIDMVVQGQPDVIRLPKTSNAQDLVDVEALIEKAEKKYNIPVGTVKMMAAIEDAQGILNVREIAHATPRLVAIAIGGYDFLTNLGTKRTSDGFELLFARSQIVLAARDAGIQAIDTVYGDIKNKEGFLKEATLIKDLGFDGKSCIHPSQIAVMHKLYTPSQKEINHSLKIMDVIKRGGESNAGVFVVDGRMVDGPIITSAERTLALAEASGLIVEYK